MSVNHAAAHMPQSLPSFAQAFSNSSLNNIPSNSNALPPIQSQSYERTRQATSPSSPRHHTVAQMRSARKRSREDGPLLARAEADSDIHTPEDPRQSPKVVRIKEEDERDSPPGSPPSSALDENRSLDPNPASNTQPSPKKRRVTVSGPPQLTARPPAEQAASTLPVVINLMNADELAPGERTRHTLAVKQQQKTVAEQRRGSIPGIVSTASQSPLTAGPPRRSPPEDHLPTSKLVNIPRIGRRSPNETTGSSRCTGTNAIASGSQATNSSSRMFTPPPIIVPSQQTIPSQVGGESSKVHQSPIVQSLPPPPISFTTRRAAQSGGRKKKPADILISPRGTGPFDPLAPGIQSAPPVADRFPMAIPRLPSAISSSVHITRRRVGNVPPTPTRFVLRDAANTSMTSSTRTGAASLSPPHLSVPIASSLVPLTPNALHHPGYSGDKPAFLAPFETFYDALNDSRQLKHWLEDQLQKSGALMQSLKQQQEKMDETVEDLVEKRTRAMRDEIAILRHRVESLEETVQAGRGEGSVRGPHNGGGSGFSHNPTALQNGIPAGSECSLSYRFPAPDQRRPELTRGVLSPDRPQEKERQLSPPLVDSARHISVSAGRPDPSRMIAMEGGQFQGPHGSFGPPGSLGRGGAGQPGSSKGTPPLRPQTIPERSTSTRQTDQRAVARHGYPASANPDGRSASRGGDSRKNTAAPEER